MQMEEAASARKTLSSICNFHVLYEWFISIYLFFSKHSHKKILYIFYMSVTFCLKKEGITEKVMIPGSEISAHILIKLIADKLKLREQDILVTNPITGMKLGEMETIKDKYSVNVEKLIKSEEMNLLPGIVSNDELADMGSKGRFFMIKSSNEENIQKARDSSVWATTYANQVHSFSKVRIDFALPSSTPPMFSCSLLPIDRWKSKGWPEWKNSQAKILKKLFGVG